MRTRRGSRTLFRFDHPFRQRYRIIAGVDEAGRGPLAGPVVSAAVILPNICSLPSLADSKQLNPIQRFSVYKEIQRCALAVGVGVVGPEEIDRINILQATYAAMRLALGALILRPFHVLVDGYAIPSGPLSQTGILAGDGKSASIAAASIVAKVTRDALMRAWDRHYPHYGFAQHKGYGTPQHLERLGRHGPCAIHRRSFSPVQLALSTAQ